MTEKAREPWEHRYVTPATRDEASEGLAGRKEPGMTGQEGRRGEGSRVCWGGEGRGGRERAVAEEVGHWTVLGQVLSMHLVQGQGACLRYVVFRPLENIQLGRSTHTPSNSTMVHTSRCCLSPQKETFQHCGPQLILSSLGLPWPLGRINQVLIVLCRLGHKQSHGFSFA